MNPSIGLSRENVAGNADFSSDRHQDDFRRTGNTNSECFEPSTILGSDVLL